MDSKKDKKNEISIAERDPNKKYPEGTIFVLDEEYTSTDLEIPDCLKDK